MKMKRLCALTLSVLASAAVLVSCGDSSSSEKDSSSQSTVSSQAAGGEESKAEESSAEESKAEESAADVSAADESAADVSAADESAADESAADVSAADESAADESAADESAADESAADESTLDESKADEPSGGEGVLAKAYTEKLASKQYSIEASVNSSLTGDTEVKMDVNGDNMHLVTKIMGIETDTYTIGDKTYSLVPSMKAYTVGEKNKLSAANFDTYALTDKSKFVSTGEEDGLTVETYDVEMGSALGGNTQMKYYFDSDGTLKKIIVDAPLIGKTAIEFKSIKFEEVDVSLPDLSGMTEIKQGETLDNKSKITMTMSLLGITEDMLKKAGSSSEELAKLSDEEIVSFLTKVAKDNGLKVPDILS